MTPGPSLSYIMKWYRIQDRWTIVYDWSSELFYIVDKHDPASTFNATFTTMQRGMEYLFTETVTNAR